MSKNIVLTGLSGSGKTTIGYLLKSKLSDYEFVDTDEIIVKTEKRPINDIFSKEGENYFRKIECNIVRKISKKENQIISTGGGVVLNPQNTEDLKKNGIIFYLKTSPEVLVQRLQYDQSRPLLKTSDVKLKLENMLKVRGALYEKADFTINTDILTTSQTADEIMRIYNERS